MCTVNDVTTANTSYYFLRYIHAFSVIRYLSEVLVLTTDNVGDYKPKHAVKIYDITLCYLKSKCF